MSEEITLEEIVDSYYPLLVAYSRSICGKKGIDLELSIDYVNDLLLKWDKFKNKLVGMNEKQIRSYLYRSLSNLIIDDLRRQNRLSSLDELLEMGNQELEKIEERRLEEQRHDLIYERKERLEIYLAILPEDEREILRFHLKGYPYKEIGLMLNMKVSTVGVKINRAKQRIRDHFDD